METKKCSHCGKEILKAAKKCKYCGKWLNEVPEPKKISCPICAEQIDEETTICPYCSERIGTISVTKFSSAKQMDSRSLQPEMPLKQEKNTNSIIGGYVHSYLWYPIIKRYADFRGEMSRKQYWLFILLYNVITISIAAILCCFSMTVGIIFYFVWCMGTFIPVLAANVRRLHDIGKRGWWILVCMVPLVGPIWLLILLCKRGKTDIPNVHWTQKDTVYSAVLSVAMIFAAISSAFIGNNDSAKYFFMEEPIILPNGTKVALATDNEADVEGGYLPCGDMTIVVADGRNIKPILSSSQLRKTSDFKDVVYESLGVFADENSDWAINHIETVNGVPNYVYFEFWSNGLDVPYDYMGLVNIDTGEIVAIMYE